MDHTVAVRAQDGKIRSRVVANQHSLFEGRDWTQMMCFYVSFAYWAIPLSQIDVTCLTTATVASLRNSCSGRHCVQCDNAFDIGAIQ
jgi:hypothetical protein